MEQDNFDRPDKRGRTDSEPRRDGDRPAFGRRDDDRRDTNRRDDSRGNTRRDDDRPRFGSARNTESGPRFGNTTNRPGSDRRNDERPRDDKPRFERSSYGERSGNRPGNDRPRFDRDSDRKPGFSRDAPSRFNRDDKPRFNRDDKPRFERDDKPRFERGNKPAYNRDTNPRFDRENEPRFDGESKPRFDRESKPRFERSGPSESRFGNRDERPRTPRDSNDRPRFSRDNDRPAYNRRDNDRPERPRFDRDNKPGYDRESKPTYNRDNKPAYDRDAKPRFDRESKPRFERDAKPRFDQPRRFDTDRPQRRDDRYSNDRSDSPRPRFDDRNRENDQRRNERGNAAGPRTPHTGGPSSGDRRTGRFEKAPNYNLDAMRKNLPKAKRAIVNKRDRDQETAKGTAEPGQMRLNRYIANAGVCSRREADELIARGDIQVNGNVISEMGYKVMPTDVVKYGNKVLNPEKMVYVLLNKPKDYLTTTDDPEERRTVMELVADAGPFRIYPVGRLDRNTTGLLLMTNDGELADKLTHPSNNIRKIYQVELDKPITEAHFESLKNGIELEDGPIKPDELSLVTPDAQVVGIEIHSGRNRIVRRMFEHLGYEVTKLDRTTFAGLTKKDLPRGTWRFLEAKEVVKLKFF